MSAAAEPSMTVLIATYNRAAHLEECLQALSIQRYAGGDEVIVVDNASTDGTRELVRRCADWFPIPLRYLHESAPGKSHALALGLGHAAGAIVAFTDDDVLVAPTWVDTIRTIMRDSSVALVGGRVEPRWQRRPPRWLRFEAEHGYGELAAPLALLDYGPAVVPLERRSALGANMAVRKDALDAIGGFPAALGKLRGTLLSGEDRYVCERVREKGLRCIYAPSLTVRHWVPRERTRLTYFMRWFFWSGITNSALDRARPPRPMRTAFGLPIYLLRQAAAGSLATAGALLTGRPARAAECLTRVAFALGYIAHRWGVSAPGVALQTQTNAQHV